VLDGEAPADFHAGRERRFEARDGEAGKSDERRHARHLDGPQAEAMFVEVGLDAVDHRVAGGAVEPRDEEFHDAAIGVHRGERRAILVAPAPQAKPGARQQARGRGH